MTPTTATQHKTRGPLASARSLLVKLAALTMIVLVKFAILAGIALDHAGIAIDHDLTRPVLRRTAASILRGHQSTATHHTRDAATCSRIVLPSLPAFDGRPHKPLIQNYCVRP